MTSPWAPGPDPDAETDAERTQVLDTREFQAAPPAPPPAPRPQPAPPDAARVDRRGTVEWDLAVARANNRPSTDVGLLLLRIASLPLVLRGLHHLLNFGGFIDSLRAHAFAGQAPEVLSALVIAGEIALPVLIAIGLATRVAALLQATLMVAIFVLWTLGVAPLFHPDTGALSGEAELLYAALALPLVLTGAGRVAIDRAITAAGRERRIEKKVARRLGE